METQKLTPEQVAEVMTDEFYASQGLAEAFNNVIVAIQPSPMRLCLALLVVDRFMAAQIPDWEKVKHVAKESFDGLSAAGILPTCNPDGSVTPPTGLDSDVDGGEPTVGRAAKRQAQRAAKKKGGRAATKGAAYGRK